MNKPLLFVGGDISGIQKFIYNISSKKAAVSLKGRSAYLVEYTEKLCNDILNLPDVQKGNRKQTVYCSGGKFYLITDDTPEIRHAIDAYSAQAEQLLWNEHRGQLGIAIGYVPFCFTNEREEQVCVNGAEAEKIGELWSKITEIFTAQKNKKFSHILLRNYDQLFEVQPVGGDVRVCAITGIESNQCVRLDKDEDSIWVLPSVKEQVERGMALRNEQHTKTFEEYAKNSYLGILRMDVDRLGERFIHGFGSLGEYTAFSSKLKRFFDEVVPAISKKDYYTDYLTIIYAGGDDLFTVGRWDKIVDFAADVRTQFAEYTRGENLSISGGVAIVGAKFPIAKAAEMAGEAEEKAKANKNGAKNAICFLGETVDWGTEFDAVRSLKDEFLHQIKDNGLSRGILHKLMTYAAIATENKSMKYMWHSVYYLTRLTDRCNSEAKAFVHNLRDHQLTKGVRQYQLTALAARWAELELRNEKQ